VVVVEEEQGGGAEEEVVVVMEEEQEEEVERSNEHLHMQRRPTNHVFSPSFPPLPFFPTPQTSNETVARILLEQKGAKAQTVNQDGASPLHFTCAGDTTSITTTALLLERRANPNLPDRNFGCSPLHYAASCPDARLVELLLAHGADATLRDSERFLPETYAEQAGLVDVQTKLQAAREEREKNGPPAGAASSSSSEWQVLTDPATGNQYEYNASTGETRWITTADTEAASETAASSVEGGGAGGGGGGKEEVVEPQQPAEDPASTLSLEEQLANEARLKQERLADALRQIEPARGLPPEAFSSSSLAGSSGDGVVGSVLAAVLKEHPAALLDEGGPEKAAEAADKAAAKLQKLPDLLSTTAAQHHVESAERKRGNRSDEWKAVEKELQLAVSAKKFGIADRLQQKLEAMEADEESKIQTGADAKVAIACNTHHHVHTFEEGSERCITREGGEGSRKRRRKTRSWRRRRRRRRRRRGRRRKKRRRLVVVVGVVVD
jgi:hypothetical protein